VLGFEARIIIFGRGRLFIKMFAVKMKINLDGLLWKVLSDYSFGGGLLLLLDFSFSLLVFFSLMGAFHE
jgi:hypothetical protein